jgi:hypothetical protein
MELRDELTGADFGDRRLSRRLIGIAEQLASGPDASFPIAAGGDAALEATYRFLNNQAVSPELILAPHIQATAKRVREAGTAIVAHDTTEFEFSGERSELGWLDRRRKGFLAHFALAMSADGSRRPLGVLGLSTIFRDREPKERSSRRQRRFAPNSEERRWANLVEKVESTLGRQASMIHVMDCEADNYRLFAQLVAEQWRFVVRMTFDRRVSTESGEPMKVSDTFRGAAVVLSREVPIAARKSANGSNQRRAHPPRSARVATLSVTAQRITLLRPDWAGNDCPPELEAHIVRVWEEAPPDGTQPIEWRLLTTEPIRTKKDVARIVDIYRTRWVIEEYFKALKTGCALERRQLENKRAILNALAVFAPIAWQLLLLRSLSRTAPDEPSPTVLTRLRLALLERHPKLNLRSGATVREAMLAVAQLGGHIKNNGDPGWLVLGRGYEKLLLLEEGARLIAGCDQS